MELPIEGSKWIFDGLLLNVDAVKKKGRGHYIAWTSESAIGPLYGRTPLKEWERKAKAA